MLEGQFFFLKDVFGVWKLFFFFLLNLQDSLNFSSFVNYINLIKKKQTLDAKYVWYVNNIK